MIKTDMNSKLLLPLLILGAAVLCSCGGGSSSSSKNNGGGDDSLTEGTDDTSTNIATAVAFKASTIDEPEYLIAEDLMSGTINAQGVGIEHIGWNYFNQIGNTVFVAGYENFEAQSYTVDANGELITLASFTFDAPIEVFGNVDDEILLASDTPRDGSHSSRTLYEVSASTGLITNKLTYQIHDLDTGVVGEGTVAYPFGLIQRDSHLYIPFQKLDDQGYFTTPDADTAYVAVYDYPLVIDEASGDVLPTKIISDDRTSNIGVSGSSNGLVKADNGDLYSFSNGTRSGGFSPASTKPSGILRVNSGETEFDESYFFNITEATSGGSIFWLEYVGEDKAMARIILSEEACLEDEAAALAADAEDGDLCTWSAFGRDYFNQKLVILDLVNQTVTDVAGVPLHAKRYTPSTKYTDNKAYLSIETADDAYVYEVDVETATATKGALVEGKTIKGFFNFS